MENLKRLVSLWRLLATKSQLSQYVSTKDLETFERRAEAEGYTFLTQTLPRLYKSLDAALKAGRIESPVVGFKSSGGTAYPLFLENAWSSLFSKEGTIKDYSSDQVGAVICIRQLSAIFYKLELEYTVDQENHVIDAFKQAEYDLWDLDLSAPTTVGLLTRARKVVCRLLAGEDPLAIRPRHGGGSSACQVEPWERYCSFRYIRRLDLVYPYDWYFFYNHTHLSDQLDALLEAEEEEPQARVVLVPKDSRGPRLISAEPREFMFIQQGLRAKFVDIIRKHPAIERQIGFEDQTRNRVLARKGSIDQSYATLDLKEASDRVSWELVKSLFPENWVTALGATRSHSTVLPDGTIVPLSKFAPMGSAVCFPVEAICFWAIAIAASRSDKYVKNLFDNCVSRADKKLSVFGDDIIVPTEHAQSVIGALESVGLLVNRDKSYWTGPFRESCGGDYFHGHNVTPVRCKAVPIARDAKARYRTSKLVNNLCAKYGDGISWFCLHELYESWYGPQVHTNRWTIKDDGNVAVFHDGQVLIDRYIDIPNACRTRYNKRLNRREVKVPVERAVEVNIDGDRWGQILRRELEMLEEQPASLGTLAKRVEHKYGWVAL